MNQPKLETSWKVFKNDYKILQIIGQGSSGMVVKAKNRKSG
jgi:hypothetical protein